MSPSQTRKVLRKSSETFQKAISSPVYEFGPFRLDTAELQLLREGKAVPLTPKVYEVLRLLVQNSGHMLGKDELLKAVWPDSFVEEGNLTRNISTLRSALGENSEEPRYIETVPKRGYRFIAGVREFQDQSAELLVTETTGAHVVSEEEEVSSQRSIEAFHEPEIRSGEVQQAAWSPEYIFSVLKNHTRTAALALATLVIAVAAVVYFFDFAKGTEAIDSVAVMPFVNVNNDPNTEYLSDGISDSIINSLSQVPNLKVMSLSSTLRYKGPQTDPQMVGRELNVRAVLMGRLINQGDAVTISTELVDVRDSRRLWGGQYNRKLADILQVQAEIAREISEKLRLRLSSAKREQLAKRDTESTEAFLLYQQGRNYLQKGTGAGVRKGIEYFDQAIKTDPSYAPAYVGLARAYWDLSSPLPPDESRQKLGSLLLKALELNDHLAEAHALLGTLRREDDDWLAADREFKRALELNPNSVDAHTHYSAYLLQIGRHDEAIAEQKRALELDPLSPILTTWLGRRFSEAGQYDRAIEQFRKALEMDPNYAVTHTNLGVVYLRQGKYQEAVAELEKARALDNSPERRRRALLAYAYAVSGKRDEAQKILGELKELAKQRYIPAMSFAIIYTGLGDKDQAFAWLEKAYKDRSGPPYLKIGPLFDSLRSDPRFADFTRRKGLAT